MSQPCAKCGQFYHNHDAHTVQAGDQIVYLQGTCAAAELGEVLKALPADQREAWFGKFQPSQHKSP